jgi:hypothetical protein
MQSNAFRMAMAIALLSAPLALAQTERSEPAPTGDYPSATKGEGQPSMPNPSSRHPSMDAPNVDPGSGTKGLGTENLPGGKGLHGSDEGDDEENDAPR